jgi:hypothetical protein
LSAKRDTTGDGLHPFSRHPEGVRECLPHTEFTFDGHRSGTPPASAKKKQ